MQETPLDRTLRVLALFLLGAFSLGITLQETALLAFFLFQLLIALRYQRQLPVLLGPGRRAAFALMVSLLVTAAISQFRFPDSGATRIHWAFVAFWAISGATAALLNGERIYRALFLLSLPGLVFSAVHGFDLEQLSHTLDMGLHNDPRLEGFLSTPINYAETLAVLLAWGLARFGRQSPDEPKHHWWLFVLVAALVATRTGAGAVALVILLIWHVLKYPNQAKHILGLGVFATIGYGLVGHFIGWRDFVDLPVEHWIRGWETFIANPFVGIGPNKFLELTGGPDPYNTLLGIAAEAGILGLAAYVFFMVRTWLALGQRTFEDAWVKDALSYVFVIYWIFGMVSYNFSDSRLLIMHALHWALILKLPAKEA